MGLAEYIAACEIIPLGVPELGAVPFICNIVLCRWSAYTVRLGTL